MHTHTTHTQAHTHTHTHTHTHKHTREHTPTTQYPDTRTHTQAALTPGAWENRRRRGGAGGGDGKQSCEDKCSSGKRLRAPGAGKRQAAGAGRGPGGAARCKPRWTAGEQEVASDPATKRGSLARVRLYKVTREGPQRSVKRRQRLAFPQSGDPSPAVLPSPIPSVAIVTPILLHDTDLHRRAGRGRGGGGRGGVGNGR